MTGGRLAGRRIGAPRGGGVRPTADRVREALFARLGPLEGARVLDLYAGTGALGIEALSRGARQVVFVERASASITRLRANLAELELSAASRVVRSDACAAIRRLDRAGRRFDLILMDPPYRSAEAMKALREAARCQILAPGGTLVIEASRRHPPGNVEGLVRLDERVHGDTLVVRFGTSAAGRPAADG